MSRLLCLVGALAVVLAVSSVFPADSAEDVMGMLREIANDRRIHSIKTFNDILSFPHNTSALDRFSAMLRLIEESIVS